MRQGQISHWKLGPLQYSRVAHVAALQWGSKDIYRCVGNVALITLGKLCYTRICDHAALNWGQRTLLHYQPGSGLGFGKLTN